MKILNQKRKYRNDRENMTFCCRLIDHAAGMLMPFNWRALVIIGILLLLHSAPHHNLRDSDSRSDVFSKLMLFITPGISMVSAQGVNGRVQCPSFADNSACPCYKFEDGKFYTFTTFIVKKKITYGPPFELIILMFWVVFSYY